MANDQYNQFNCYIVLEISPDATPGEIKAAMRKASLKSHPDLGGSHSQQVKINVAYNILSDPVQRQAHDIFWKVSRQRDTSKPRDEKRHTKGQTASTPHSFASFKARLEAAILAKKAEAWRELESLTRSKLDELLKAHEAQRNTFYVTAAGGVVAGTAGLNFPLLWVLSIVLGLISLSKLNGIRIDNQHVPLFGNFQQALNQIAGKQSAERCHRKAESYDRYTGELASIAELTARASSFDDSENQVARRIVAALFLSGFTPKYYDSEMRTILFSDGDEKLLVRFRHRSGAAVNVAYVEKLKHLMDFHKSSNGLLFCSPGLSGNAANLAQAHNIKCYTLERMNLWIDDILASNRTGPKGDVMDSLDVLRQFLSGITPRVSRWTRRHRRY